MKLFGRTEKIIDWNYVNELLEANCHGTEIAAHFDMHPSTFYRKVEEKYGMTFTQFSQEKKGKGDSLLRYQQYLKALGKSEVGDNTLLIWLGKTRLQQKESSDNSQTQITAQQVQDSVNAGH